jgi:hypothetical protein
MSVRQDLDAEVVKERGRVHGLAIRSTELTRYLDLFLACAIGGVLGNRFFLVLTGYPQVGNGTLHISHAIWGGAMMLTALVAAIAFVAPSARGFVAVLGGAGFGWFVDELGKFITRDVNYFFKPTLALIYLVFILLYLAFRALERRRYRADEALLNALEAVKSAAVGRLDEGARLRALALLDQTCADEPLAKPVGDLLRQVPTIRAPAPGRFARVRSRALSVYERWTVRRGFRFVVATFFVVLALFDVAQIVLLRVNSGGFHGFTQWATAGSSLLSLVFILIGAGLLARARLTAFRWFELGVLVSIFVTQVFLFEDHQLAAVLDLLVTIVVWMGLRSAIRLEELARGVHESYRERRRAVLDEDDPALAKWEDLPETLRTSNRDQAAHFVDKLDAVHCAAVRYSGNEAPPFVFTPAEVEVLARLEHERWCAERTRQGWTPGPTRDATARTTPYLVDWEELTENVRDLDRDAVREMPAQLARSGLAVVRLDAPAPV